MLRILKSTVASADLSSAMEREPIFKNRVSQKNDRSRRNFFAILLVFLISLNVNTVMGQQQYFFGYSWENKSVVIDGVKGEYNVVTRVTNSLPAHIAGLRPFDVILSENTSEDGTITLTVKRTGNQTLNIRINGVPVLSDNWYCESNYFSIVSLKMIYLTKLESFELVEPISIISDPEADLFACKTFDFEYSNQNALIQKEVAAILESKLQSKGLKRDRENPDLLISVDFTAERKDQYIHAFTISMADVSKMKANGNESSIVWQADYIISAPEKISHKKFTDGIGNLMLDAFPFTELGTILSFTYWYTGLIFDAEKPGSVAGVVSGSPADIAGIKAGDKIKGSSQGKATIFKETPTKLGEKYNSVYNRNIGIRYPNAIDRIMKFYHEKNNYNDPLYNSYINNYDSKKPLIFTVEKPDKRIQKVSVLPKRVTETVYNLNREE